MRVVRAGGRYLEGLEQRWWVALVAVLTLAIFGIVLVVGVGLAGVGIVAVAVALSAGAKVVQRLANVRNGRRGERLVTDNLRRLSDDYWLVNDIMLPRGRGNVDHVLIGPCGVVAIETKRIAGRIGCYGDEWSVNGHKRGSVSHQVNSGASAVRYFLIERHPDLAATALRWVEPVIVFTHPHCELDVSRARATVVRFSQLPDVVRALTDKHRMAPAIAARLADSLAASQAPSVDARRLKAK